MHSFSAIVTLACAMLAVAAPAPSLGLLSKVLGTSSSCSNSPSLILGVEAALGIKTPALSVSGAVKVAPRGIPFILADVTVKITPLCNELKSLEASCATYENISPITAKIKVILVAAIVEIKAMAGCSKVSILSLITVTQCAQALATLVCLIFTALSVCLKLVISANLALVLPCFSEVGSLVCSLIFSVCSVVDGLLVILCPLLISIKVTVSSLNLLDVFASCGIAL